MKKIIANLLNKKHPEPLELVVISKKSRGGHTSQNHVVFFSSSLNPKSMAAGVLLNNELRFQDVDYLDDYLQTWLEFREKYLNKVLKEKGDLVCSYCGKPRLEIGGKSPKDLEINNKNPNLATVDHITALANGGQKYDEKNLCVSCRKCNSKKGTKPAEVFMERFKS